MSELVSVNICTNENLEERGRRRRGRMEEMGGRGACHERPRTDRGPGGRG